MIRIVRAGVNHDTTPVERIECGLVSSLADRVATLHTDVRIILPMVVTIFRERLRNDADVDAYAALSNRMHELVAQHAGFISIKSYLADDGETVSIEMFDDMASLQAWRSNPEHVEAQRRGREEFYAEYSYETCQVERSGSWSQRSSR